MSLQKVCEQYRLDGELIAALAKKGVFCADGFSDGDVCRARAACFLLVAGLGTERVAPSSLTRDGGRTQRALLRRLRADALERSHAEQRRVDKLDCLLREIDSGRCPLR